MLSSYDKRRWWLTDNRLAGCRGPFSTAELYWLAHEYNIKHWQGDADPIALCLHGDAVFDTTSWRNVATLAEDNY
jgi:hypothetical protein